MAIAIAIAIAMVIVVVTAALLVTEIANSNIVSNGNGNGNRTESSAVSRALSRIISGCLHRRSEILTLGAQGERAREGAGERARL